MEMPTVKNLLIFSDESGKEIDRAVIDFINTNDLKQYDIDEIIISEMPDSFYNNMNYIVGDYINEGAGRIECSNDRQDIISVLKFTFNTVLEYSGKYFALIEI